MMNSESIKSMLKEKGYRITRARLAVLNVLDKKRDRFVSAEEIFRHIQKSHSPSCDPASVYRALGTFTKLNIVAKSDFHGKASKFRLNRDVPQKAEHTHFFQCQKCHHITPLETCLIAPQIRKLQSQGYRDLNHHLEINGVCPPCAAPA